MQYQLYLKEQLQELINNPNAMALDGAQAEDPETMQKIAELHSVLEQLVS